MNMDNNKWFQEPSDASLSPQSISHDDEEELEFKSSQSDSDHRSLNSTANICSKKQDSPINVHQVPCVNRCGKAIDCNRLEDHIAYDCPLTVVDCTFKHAGCEVRLPRKDMPIHLAHAVVYHLSKQTAAYEERLKLLEAENERLALRCKRLEAKHEELEHHVSLSHVLKTLPRDINQYDEDFYVNTASLPHNQPLHNPYLCASQPIGKSAVLTPVSIAEASVRPVTLTMMNFEQHQQNNDDWVSQPFYTHSQGYKMCLRVTANGQGSGKGTHITVAVYLMNGEFDDQLEWPFKGDITIQLLNQQEDGEDHTRIIHQAQGERGDASGAEKFISAWGINKFKAHNELYPMYVKHDSLNFRILALVKQSAAILLETAV